MVPRCPLPQRGGRCICRQVFDRFWRNYDDIIEQGRMLTKDKGVSIVVLDMFFSILGRIDTG